MGLVWQGVYRWFYNYVDIPASLLESIFILLFYYSYFGFYLFFNLIKYIKYLTHTTWE